MVPILQPIVIKCQFDVWQLEIIETALNQMSLRDQVCKDDIRKTLASVQKQRVFGEQVR